MKPAFVSVHLGQIATSFLTSVSTLAREGVRFL